VEACWRVVRVRCRSISVGVMSASQPISVKFEGSEDTLTISEAVAQQYTFFQALLDGGFQEPAERTVTLKEISRPIAAVVLQRRNDMLKDITRENLLDCLSALDFLNCLQDDRPKLIDNVGRKVLRNRWHDDQDLCRAMLKMAFDRPLIRSLIGWHYDLGRACAPYLVENAKQVAAQWAVSSSDADIGIRAFIIGLLGDLKRLIDTNAGSMRLETLKRFWWTPPPHRTSTRRQPPSSSVVGSPASMDARSKRQGARAGPTSVISEFACTAAARQPKTPEALPTTSGRATSTTRRPCFSATFVHSR